MEITQEHLKLIERLNWNWTDSEYGGLEIDPKKPFGNSYAEGDIAEILGWDAEGNEGLSERQEERAGLIYKELEEIIPQMLKEHSREIWNMLGDSVPKHI